MNRFKKRAMIIVAAICNISLTLTAAAVATYAWYTSTVNAIIKAAGSEVTITADDSIGLTYEVLAFDDDLKAGKSYQGDSREFKLRTFDRYIDFNRKYENAILRVNAHFPDGLTDSKEVHVDFTCHDLASHVNKFFASTGIVSKYTSNVIQFKSSVVSYKTTELSDNVYTANSYIDDTLDEEGMWVADAAISYETARLYFSTQEASTSFVSAYNGTANKHHYSITDVPYFPTLGDKVVSDAVIYIECSYNPQAAEYYINHRSDSVPELTGDIDKISFSAPLAPGGGYEKVTDNSLISDYTGQYLAVYDREETATRGGSMLLDGSINIATPGNSATSIGEYANFSSVTTNDGFIKATGPLQDKELSITKNGGSYELTTTQNGAIGNDLTNTDTESPGTTAYNIIGNASGSNKLHTMGYGQYTQSVGNINYAKVNKGSTDYYLSFRDHYEQSKFLYRPNTDNQSHPVSFYKYNSIASTKILTAINHYSAKTSYNVGDEFVKPIVKATFYKKVNGEYQNVEEDVDIKAKCIFEGYDMSVAGPQKVHIYYSYGGITKSVDLDINVYSTAYITVDPAEVTLYDQENLNTANVSATLHNITGTPSYSWSALTEGIVTLTNQATSECTIAYLSSGTTILRCTVSVGGVAVDHADCRVYCDAGDTAYFQKVTTSLDNWSGKYLIVNETAQRIFDSTAGTPGSGTNYQSVDIENSTIRIGSEYAVTITKDGDNGYFIQNNAGKYLGRTSGNDGGELPTSESGIDNAISLSSGNATITSGSKPYYLRYNTGGYFRYYTSASQQPIQLYKSVSSSDIVSVYYKVTNLVNDQEVIPTHYFGETSSTFDMTGLEFYKVLGNGQEIKITDTENITFSNIPSASESDGNFDVQFTYASKHSATIYGIPYEHLNLSKITLSVGTGNNAPKSWYFTDGTFDKTGLTVTAHFSNGPTPREKDFTNDAGIEWKLSKNGTTWYGTIADLVTAIGANDDVHVAATLNYNGTPYTTYGASGSTAFDIDIKTKLLTGIEIDKQTTSFADGGTFALGSNVEINKVYNDGLYTEPLSASDVTFRLDSTSGTVLTPGTSTLTADGNSHSVYVILNSDTTKTTSYSITIASTPVKADSIAVGDTIYIVCEDYSVQLNDINTSGSKHYGNGEAYSTDIDPNVYPLTVEAGSAADTFSFKNGNNYLTWSSDNTLDTTTTKSSNSSWTVSFDNSGNAIINNYATSTRKLQWNNPSPRFACYTSNQTAIQIYKIGGSTPQPSYTVTGVTVTPTTLSLDAYASATNHPHSATISATVNGTGNPPQGVDWASSNTNVATVSISNGVVTITAVGAGNCTITATSQADDDYSASCTVTVTDSTPAQGGTVSGSATLSDLTGNAWTRSGTGTYTSSGNTTAVKFDSAGDYIQKLDIFSGTASSTMTKLEVTIYGKWNKGSASSDPNTYEVQAVNSSGTNILNTTKTGCYATTAKSVTFTISGSLSNCTGIKIIYKTKSDGNWGVGYNGSNAVVSWTATYSG